MNVADRELASTDEVSASSAVTAARTVANTEPPGPLPATALLPRGTTIRRYVVLDQIGAGGMGVVYAAYDYGLDRRIALKLVRDHGGATARARLIREAQVLARLSHPNVVAVYDVGEHDGEVYVAMELVEGASLRAWLAEAARDWRSVLAVFRAAGAGLAAAHAAGIVHRDVKPDNVLIDAAGAARVGDFGLAMLTRGDGAEADGRPGGAAVTQTGAVIGTPAYMAPEQHAGDVELDARTDQFGFCVALYEALYETRPFAGKDSAALHAAIVAGQIAPPAAGRDVPGWVRRAVLRGLAADPAARFPSMTALLDALAHDPRLRRRRGWIAGAAIAATGAAVVAVRLAGGDTGQACRPDPARLAGVWDPPRRAAMQAAFAHSGAPSAGQAWARVEGALDDRAAGWQRMWSDACEATRRGEQSPALLDARMACLDDRLGELRALGDLLVGADRARVDHAVDAVRGLERLDACARAQALHPGQRASDPAARDRRERWAQIQAVSLVGDRPRALEQSRALAGDARAAGDRAIEAEALRSVGRLLTAKGDAAGAEDALYGAIAAAQAADADALAARAWFDLAWLVGQEGSNHDAAQRFLQVARGAIERLGGSPQLEAILEDRVGVVFYDQGKYADAAPHLERGLALREQLYGPTSADAAASLQHLAMLRTAEGQKPLALELHRRARDNAERALGPDHPDTIGYLMGEAVAQFDLGHDDESLALLQRALAGVLRNDPDDARNAADLLNNISEIQRKRGDLAGARDSQARAVAMYERTAGKDSPLLAVPLANLALTLSDLGAHDDALAQVDRALALRLTALGADHPDVAETLSTRGVVLAAAHRPAQAVAPLERAIELRASIAGAAAAVAADRFELARALIASRGDRRRAIELATTARAAFAEGGDTAAVERVDAWRAGIDPTGGAGPRAPAVPGARAL